MCLDILVHSLEFLLQKEELKKEIIERGLEDEIDYKDTRKSMEGILTEEMKGL